MSKADQLEIFETYMQDDPDLVRIVRMIVKKEMAHSNLEARLVKDLLHAYECLGSRDAFLVRKNIFPEYAADPTPAFLT